MKSLSYKQEMGDIERICTQKGPTESRATIWICSLALREGL